MFPGFSSGLSKWLRGSFPGIVLFFMPVTDEVHDDKYLNIISLIVFAVVIAAIILHIILRIFRSNRNKEI